MKKKEFVRDEWRVLSDKFVRHHRLPHGTKLFLEHHSGMPGGRPRKARNDKTFTRRHFRGRISDGETVSDLIGKYLVPSLTADPSKRGFKIRLRGPNGEEVKNSRMLIKTIRAWPPLPDFVAEEFLNYEIDEISNIADRTLRDAEELRDDHYRVLRGYLRALIRRYGLPDFGGAVDQEEKFHSMQRR